MKLAATSQKGRKGAAGLRGFTLAEVVIALAVLATMAAGCYVGFNALNAYAVSSRLYSEAQTCAQNQIDLILSKEPFDPINNKVPAVLGGQVLASGASTTVTTPNVFIYQDPVNGKVVVTGRSEERRVGKECRSGWWRYK